MSTASPISPSNNRSRDLWRSLDRRRWIQAALAALAFHLLIAFIPWHRLLSLTLPSPKQDRIEVATVSPEQIARMKARQQKLLLDRGQRASETAPSDARYFSDRNIRVDREQRARKTAVLPKLGSPEALTQKPESPRTSSQKEPRALQTASTPSAIPLHRLGVPLQFRARQAQAAPQANTEPEESRSASEPGGDQSIDDLNLPEGGENLLNAQQSVFYSFYSRLYQAVGPVWQSLLMQVRRAIPEGQYSTQVEVLMDREGKIIDVRFLGRSGIPEFDHAVEQAWQRLPRFPNPPRGLVKPDGYVHTGWNFTVRVDRNFFQVAPPRRVY